MDPELLQTLAADPDAARRMLESALAERAAGDPRMAAMMQMLAQQQTAAPPPSAPARERPAAVERVRERVREMRAELIALRERNEEIAAALGACAVCWGEDEVCDECGGEGAPGWLEPDAELFDDLVKPAADRRSRRAGETPQRREP